MSIINEVALLLSSAFASATVGTEPSVYPYHQLARALAIFIVVLANVSFAGMRAQGSSSPDWKWVAFLVGLPFTLISFVFVRPGSGMMFGVRLPKD